MSSSLQPHRLQHTRLPCPSLSPWVSSNSYPLNQWCHPLLPPSPPALHFFQCQSLFQWDGPLHQVANMLKLHFQPQSFQWIFRIDFLYDLLACSCSPRDSQESSPAPVWKHQFLCSAFFTVQFSYLYITTGKLSLWLYGLLSAKWCLCFLIHCLGLSCFSSKEQASFNFMPAITVHSGFGGQKNKTCH